jgi:hypothetical protein
LIALRESSFFFLFSPSKPIFLPYRAEIKFTPFRRSFRVNPIAAADVFEPVIDDAV